MFKGTAILRNFITGFVTTMAVAVICLNEASAHFNPGDRVQAAVTISCPDYGVCSCSIPQGTQGRLYFVTMRKRPNTKTGTPILSNGIMAVTPITM
jgi:hypothetical protein